MATNRYSLPSSVRTSVLTEDSDNQYIMIDSTIVRAHQRAACGKGGRGVRLWGIPEAG